MRWVGYPLAYRLMLAWWWLRRPHTRGTSVAIWCDGKLLLLTTSYRPGLHLPGGFMRSGEDPAAAAARETREEVGIELSPAALHAVAVIEQDIEFHHSRTHVFEIELDRSPVLRIDGGEIVAAEFLLPAQAAARQLLPLVRHYLERRGSAR